jgi:apolipoprotein N-acyltransferase
LAPEIYQRLKDYTRLYAEARDGQSLTDLVIWPESALPVHLHGLPEHESYFNELLKVGDFSLLTGTEIHTEAEGSHVSAVLFHGSYASRQEYHKVHLVPFGEYLPLRDIPPFSFLRGVLPGDFTPGTSTEPLKLAKPEVQIIPLICFEDTVGRLARRFVRPEPQMIVNITNDGWFLHSAQTEVHTANAKFRAVELRRPMVRATNTGVTCFIDTLGTVTGKLADPETGSCFIEGCLPGEVRVPRNGELTLYARHGDWFAISFLSLCGFLGCFRKMAEKRKG